MATGGAEKEDMSGDCCVLKITGILPAMTVPDLELVFESERKSGGGEIKELELAASPGEALLTYKSLEGILFNDFKKYVWKLSSHISN